MEIITGGVTAAKGFEAAAAAAEIKYRDRLDMAMIYSHTPAVVAGAFTTNVVKAAPVIWDHDIVRAKKPVHAVVVNAGIANACTGVQGMQMCSHIADETAAALQIDPQEVLIASTGVIGMQLPLGRMAAGVAKLSGSLADTPQAADAAAHAIMTTDTKPKQAAVRICLGGQTVTIGGMCKGSGMIHPNMCTMLSFITTDASINGELLQKALSESVADSYNMISVDGDTSTNDTVLVLANGEAKNPVIDTQGEDYLLFAEALHAVNVSLAKQMAGDGEGATALLEVTVTGARTKEQAAVLAKSVVTSSLVKTAIYGHDANWGRILCAMGYAGVSFDPQRVDLFFKSANGSIQIIENGVALTYSEEEATRILSAEAVTVLADVKEGSAQATAWGCDLTYDYVRINADYRS